MLHITIIGRRKPVSHNLNEELQWLGSSLGLFNLRDKDKSCFRIFIELLKCTKRSQPMSSDQLAFKLHLTRGTVVHHLNKLKESGIVIQEQKGYILRTDDLKKLVDEIESDIKKTCTELKEIADEIDKKLGF